MRRFLLFASIRSTEMVATTTVSVNVCCLVLLLVFVVEEECLSNRQVFCDVLQDPDKETTKAVMFTMDSLTRCVLERLQWDSLVHERRACSSLPLSRGCVLNYLFSSRPFCAFTTTASITSHFLNPLSKTCRAATRLWDLYDASVVM